ncbi:MAG TPA: helix-turn-helix transcriptional regulator, partial [Anaerolineaceae bacterium]|nr:helix-turn-helix transcriptional regulator [Anaerolineaceae bacterium]
MSTITGSELKRQREELKIPLEQVASETRIRLTILQDLEDEEYSELSSDAQTKGFLSLYAKYLESMGEKLGVSRLSKQDKSADDNKKSDLEDEKLIKKEPEIIPEKQISIEPSFQDNVDKTTIKTEQSLSTSVNEEQPSESQRILTQLGRELAARRRYLNLPWEFITRQT